MQVKADKYAVAKKMAQEYRPAKIRAEAYPRKRPTFMRQMGVDLSRFAETGEVVYNREVYPRLCEEDAFFFGQYLEDMHSIWIIEHAVKAQRDEITHSIAVDTILKGEPCSSLQEKYGMKTCAIRRRRQKVIEYIASILV